MVATQNSLHLVRRHVFHASNHPQVEGGRWCSGNHPLYNERGSGWFFGHTWLETEKLPRHTNWILPKTSPHGPGVVCWSLVSRVGFQWIMCWSLEAYANVSLLARGCRLSPVCIHFHLPVNRLERIFSLTLYLFLKFLWGFVSFVWVFRFRFILMFINCLVLRDMGSFVYGR